MLRRAALALAFVLFLVPGNLVAGVLQAWAKTCDAQECCCPEPERQDSIPSLEQACCCEAQPAQAPKDRPDEPLQAPQETPAAWLVQDDASCVLLFIAWPSNRIGERPSYLAQASPDPLFLRYHNLRL